MSAPAAAGTLAAQSGGAPSPQLRQQLGGSQPHTPPQMIATTQEGRKPVGVDETLSPAQPISLAGPEVSEDEGDGGSSGKKRKKQRSMAELIKGLDLNLGDDGAMGEEGVDEAWPAQGEDEAASFSAADASAAPAVGPPPTAETPKAADKPARKRKKAEEGDGDGEAKASPATATPTAADPEANQTPAVPDDAQQSGRRERKKSKYLSPPYTMVIEKKPSFSARSASGDVLDPDAAGGISSLLARCSSFGRKKEDLDLESAFVFDEATPPFAELLAELRCAAVGVMYLVASLHGSAVRRCFALFRNYYYSSTTECHGGGNKAHPAARTTVSVEEIKPPAPATAPVAADNKAPQQQDNGSGTDNLDKTPVATTKKNAPEEDNKSASGKRSYNKRKSAPAVVATTTETNSDVEEPKPRGRPKKKSKEKEDNNSAIDNNEGTGAPTLTPAAPAPSPINNNSAAAPSPAETQLQANGGFSAPAIYSNPPDQNEAKKKKRKKRSGPPGSASLIVTFAPGADLPTKDHLLRFFSKYGVLDEERTQVRAATRVACVAYATKADAQRAIASPDRDQAFAPGVATFRIKYARQARQPGGGGSEASATAGVLTPARAIPRPPLEFVKNNLESMIAALELCRPAGAGSRAPAAGSDAEADPRDELVDQMSSLLTKVNKLLADSAASDTIANGGVDAAAAASSAATVTAAAGGGGGGGLTT